MGDGGVALRHYLGDVVVAQIRSGRRATSPRPSPPSAGGAAPAPSPPSAGYVAVGGGAGGGGRRGRRGGGGRRRVGWGEVGWMAGWGRLGRG
ncbi:UNVERIFIED_CONTAM: hypothetical protein Sradi_4168500 [Sesamum radiatum]|uniref:Uncharacterized protein n=1 Tax=Sesamum radiatum TaxID=300843 RepID=A0AAW2P4E1_SESRA